jgi:hypothetical protein
MYTYVYIHIYIYIYVYTYIGENEEDIDEEGEDEIEEQINGDIKVDEFNVNTDINSSNSNLKSSPTKSREVLEMSSDINTNGTSSNSSSSDINTNGTTSDGTSSNGTTSDGTSSNGTSFNGTSSNGISSNVTSSVPDSTEIKASNNIIITKVQNHEDEFKISEILKSPTKTSRKRGISPSHSPPSLRNSENLLDLLLPSVLSDKFIIYPIADSHNLMDINISEAILPTSTTPSIEIISSEIPFNSNIEEYQNGSRKKIPRTENISHSESTSDINDMVDEASSSSSSSRHER